MTGTACLRLVVAAVVAATLAPAAVGQPSGPSVGVAGTAVQIDGKPAFLAGVSLFDALGAVPPRDLDLDALTSVGINTVRVWAHWHEPIYQGEGALTATVASGC